MRIIAGKFKGRRIRTPENNRIRPTTDKVKESMFSILTGKVEGKVVCDLFSGTGNLGLEAISRGAKYCYFGDNHRESIALIYDNIEKCHAENQGKVMPGSYEKVLRQLENPVDLFLVDPPYERGFEEKVVRMISENKLLNKNGIIMIEHFKGDIFPQEWYGFHKIKEKKYGIVVLSMYM